MIQAPDIKLIPFKKEFTPEISMLLADSYMKNNPFIAPLKLTKEQMVEEFANALGGGLLSTIFVFVEKAKYEQENKFELVGCWCFGDLIDFLPKGDVSFEKHVNYNLVPTSDKVRSYMRYMSLKPLYDKYKINKGCITRNFKLQVSINMLVTFVLNQNILEKVMDIGLTIFALKQCSKVGIECQQGMTKFGAIRDKFEIDVSDMYVLETKEQPFKGLNLKQITYVFDIQKTVEILTNFLEPKAKL